jgi:hypothetical protein
VGVRYLILQFGSLLFLSCAVNVNASSTRAIAIRQRPVVLASAPVSVILDLGRQRARALAVARDPKRTLMLRVEGIRVEGSPAVYEVYVGRILAGTLATYGAEEQNGKFIAAVPIDAAAEPALARGPARLTIRFVPASESNGTIRFQRLRLIAE